MIELNNWLSKFKDALNDRFDNRICFVGLQGSYGRGEATEQSDIDIVVILDALSPADIQTYNMMLDTLPHRELICGFLSGRSEILNWEPSDLFQLYYDTTPIFGTLNELTSVLNDDAISRAIRIGACNIYHGCVHNMLYDKKMKTSFADYISPLPLLYRLSISKKRATISVIRKIYSVRSPLPSKQS